MKTNTGNTSYRKQFALRRIIKGKTNDRAFDNCFENGDGDDIVKFVMKKANEIIPEVNWDVLNPEDKKNMRKRSIQGKLIESLKSMGVYEQWNNLKGE